MSRQQNEILLEIDRFMPSPTGDWRELDMLLSELWQGNVSTACLPVLFRVFERFPKCLVSCDHVPRRSWPLFRARAMLGDLIAGFSSPGIQPQQEQSAA